MAARTTAKVATLTGAAKDDVLQGGTEDSLVTDLNVLANDPGAARLWSLDQGVPAMAGGAQVPSALDGTFVTLLGALISANEDGTVHYDGSQLNLQYLQEGETATDTFVYTVRMASGALSTASVSVTVTGVNDIAVVSNDAGAVTEDGTLTAGGTLTVSDADHDQSAFGAVGDLAGTYGDFLFNTSTGAWSYVLRNGDANVQALIAGQQVFDTLVVGSLDGSDSGTITVTINGADEAVILDNGGGGGGGVEFLANNGKFVSGHYIIENFTSNDTLRYAGGLKPEGDPNWSVLDFGADSVMDTVIVFKQNGNGDAVDVVLVGYTAFTADQLTT
jgi:VCBS repeat-containing protein